MFKIPSTLPSKTSSAEELTDFMECECIKNDSVSIIKSIKPILLVSDEIHKSGIIDDSDVLNNKQEDILSEMDRREFASDGKYPFEFRNKGYNIKIKRKDIYYWVYSYLLFSTRLDMIKYKSLNNVDGTKLLERLSALVAKEYFGQRAQSLVFGTADEEITIFEEKVNNLCECMGEGHSFLNRNHYRPRANDDKLDVAVWKDFTDRNHSKIIGFGQCKTGTTWDDKETIELQPSDFCQKWMRDTPISPPVKMFFTSQYFPISDYAKAKNAGVVFDRFRILDFLPHTDQIDKSLTREIKQWTSAAMSL